MNSSVVVVNTPLLSHPKAGVDVLLVALTCETLTSYPHAFNGDAIPYHLITAEAWDLYWQLLDKDGILAIHVSNDYLDLIPVVQHHNQRINRRELVQVFNEDDDGWDINAASWLLETANRRVLSEIGQLIQPPRTGKYPVEWTDEKSSVLELFY